MFRSVSHLRRSGHCKETNTNDEFDEIILVTFQKLIWEHPDVLLLTYSSLTLISLPLRAQRETDVPQYDCCQSHCPHVDLCSKWLSNSPKINLAIIHMIGTHPLMPFPYGVCILGSYSSAEHFVNDLPPFSALLRISENFSFINLVVSVEHTKQRRLTGRSPQ